MKSKGIILGIHQIGENFANINGVRLLCYRDLTRRANKLYRPQEVMVASSDSGRHHLTHLGYLPRGDSYISLRSTPMLATIHDILPISLDYHCSGDLNNCASLVLTANANHYSVHLFDFTKGCNYEIVKEQSLKSYAKHGYLPLLRFKLDYNKELIKLLIHDRPLVKQSTDGLYSLSDIYIDNLGGVLDYKVQLREMDLTRSLMARRVNLQKTFNDFLYFTTHYN
ncbi:MAG TPA: hypothetical protein PLJ58_01635 [bacterium]|nr:hypothetical protein [bacterium]